MARRRRSERAPEAAALSEAERGAVRLLVDEADGTAAGSLEYLRLVGYLAQLVARHPDDVELRQRRRFIELRGGPAPDVLDALRRWADLAGG